jgi:hypothetical protein
MCCYRFNEPRYGGKNKQKDLYSNQKFMHDLYHFCNDLKLWTFKPQFLKGEVPERHLNLWKMELKMAK